MRLYIFLGFFLSFANLLALVLNFSAGIPPGASGQYLEASAKHALTKYPREPKNHRTCLMIFFRSVQPGRPLSLMLQSLMLVVLLERALVSCLRKINPTPSKYLQ